MNYTRTSDDIIKYHTHTLICTYTPIYIPGVYIGFTLVTTNPASMAPNDAIGNSGKFGRQIATTSPRFKLKGFCCNRTANAAE